MQCRELLKHHIKTTWWNEYNFGLTYLKLLRIDFCLKSIRYNLYIYLKFENIYFICLFLKMQWTGHMTISMGTHFLKLQFYSKLQHFPAKEIPKGGSVKNDVTWCRSHPLSASGIFRKVLHWRLLIKLLSVKIKYRRRRRLKNWSSFTLSNIDMSTPL